MLPGAVAWWIQPDPGWVPSPTATCASPCPTPKPWPTSLRARARSASPPTNVSVRPSPGKKRAGSTGRASLQRQNARDGSSGEQQLDPIAGRRPIHGLWPRSRASGLCQQRLTTQTKLGCCLCWKAPWPRRFSSSSPTASRSRVRCTNHRPNRTASPCVGTARVRPSVVDETIERMPRACGFVTWATRGSNGLNSPTATARRLSHWPPTPPKSSKPSRSLDLGVLATDSILVTGSMTRLLGDGVAPCQGGRMAWLPLRTTAKSG